MISPAAVYPAYKWLTAQKTSDRPRWPSRTIGPHRRDLQTPRQGKTCNLMSIVDECSKACQGLVTVDSRTLHLPVTFDSSHNL